MADNAKVPKETLVEMYRRMLLIRRFEEKAGQQYQMGHIGGFCHLYIGQEAVSVGTFMALKDDDYGIAGYREHGHPIARGGDPKPIMAELFGKATGAVHGKGGSMHIFDPAKNFLGGYGIVGGQIPLATGVAFAAKFRGEKKCCACFFGDAAVNQGSFHESLNLASLWKLPAIYIIENNRYGMGTAVERSTAIKELSRRADSYSMPGAVMDGMDVLDCYRVVKEAAERAYRGDGPTLIEARTYRFRGHSMADPATYRTKEEVEQERKRDPIHTFGERLLKEKVLAQAELDKLDEGCKAKVEEAIKFAEESPEPADDAIYKDVYSDPSFVERMRFTGQ